MGITRQAAKALIKLTPGEVKDICPDFNTDNWDVLVAFARGQEIEVDGLFYISQAYLYRPRSSYTIKPRTIKIGDMEVPEPVREPMVDGREYWFVDTTDLDVIQKRIWNGSVLDRLRLKRGRIQLTEEGALAQAIAEVIASGGTVD